MKIACEKCGTAYDVNEGQIPAAGMSIKCTVCFHSFTIMPPSSGADLPGLAQSNAQNLPGLPGLPPQNQAPNLPGLPPQNQAPNLPGLPPQNQAPNLPGLPPQNQAPNLPGLPPQNQAPNLPGLPPQNQAPNLPGLPPQNQAPNLPGLPPQNQAPNLPGLPPQNQAPNLPGLPQQNQTGGTGYGEVSLDDGADDGLLEVDLPAPSAGNIDLPTPASSGIDLPGLSNNIDLPAPSGGLDLPAPSGGLDLPAPSGGLDLPAPSGGLDLPAPSGGLDLPAPSGGLDLPAPSDSIGLPAPSASVPGSADEDDVITFSAPKEGNAIPEMITFGDDYEDDNEAPVDIRSTDSFFTKKRLIIGGSALGGVVVLAVVLAMVLGGDGGAKQAATYLKQAQGELQLDTLVGYKEAVRDFGKAANALKENAGAIAKRAQALAAMSYRFGLKQHLSEAKSTLENIGSDHSKNNVEVKIAKELLLLAEGKAKEAEMAFGKLSDKYSKHAMLALYSGWASESANHQGMAIKFYDRALNLNKNLAGALFGLYRANKKIRKESQANAFLKKTLEISTRHEDGLLALIKKALFEKKYERAKGYVKSLDGLGRSNELSPTRLSDLHAVKGLLSIATSTRAEARSEFEQSLKINPKNISALIGSGKLDLEARKYQEASDSFKAVQNIDPSDVQSALLLAETQLYLGQPTPAREALLAVLKHQPHNATIHLVLGQIEERVKAYVTAQKAYEKALVLDAKYVEAYRALALLHLKKKEKKEAFAVLEKATEVLKDDPRVTDAKGMLYLKLGELTQAEREFRKAFKEDHRLNSARFHLGQVLVEQKKYDEAKSVFEKLELRDIDYPGLAAAFGKLYLALKKPKLAASAYDRALKSTTPTIELHFDAGWAFIAAGQWEKARNQANEAIRIEGASGQARALRAEAAYLEGDYGEALSEVQRAISREKKVHYYIILARVLEKLRRIADAADAYQNALKLDPKRSDLRLERARLQVRGGAVKDGLKGLKRLLNDQPKLAVAHLYVGLAMADLGKEKDALASYRRALSFNPNQGEASFRIAQHYYDLQQFGKALTQLKHATKNGKMGDMWFSDALFLLGQVANKRNDKKTAIAALEEFLKVAHHGDSNRVVAKKLLASLKGSSAR